MMVSGKPDKVNSQEGADSKTFVMGSDAAEFVNKVEDQVRAFWKSYICQSDGFVRNKPQFHTVQQKRKHVSK